MTQLNGLKNIIGNTGTLHTLPEPPERSDYPTVEAYDRAYDAWWLRVNTWHATTHHG